MDRSVSSPAKESLAFVKQANATGVHIDPGNYAVAILSDSATRNMIYSLPAIVVNYQNIQIAGPYTSFDSLSKTIRTFAAAALGTFSEAMAPLIDQKFQQKDLQKKREQLEQIPGFTQEGETVFEALRRHPQELYKSIEAGHFDTNPEKLIEAISEMGHASLNGHWEMFPTFSTQILTDIQNAVGGGISATRPVLFDQDKFRRAEVHLEKFKIATKEQIAQQGSLTLEQEQIFSRLRGAIEIPLMANKDASGVRDFLNNVYAQEIDEIQPGSGKEIINRIKMVDECQKLFESNVPQSRLERGVNKILEKLGFPAPELGTNSREQPMTL